MTLRSPPRSTSETEHGKVSIVALSKAAHALSTERNVNNLVKAMLDIMEQASGATRAILYLNTPEGFKLAADSEPGAFEPIDIVAATRRSQTMQLMNDATAVTERQHDPYLKAVDPQSVLCMPLLHQARLRGVIYLENRTVKHAFSIEVVELVKMLGTQAAASLDNARVIKSLETELATRMQDIDTLKIQLRSRESDDTVTQMAGGFAHEMRNMLSGARFALQTLHTDSQDPDSVLGRYQLARQTLERLKDAPCDREALTTQLTDVAEELQNLESLSESMFVLMARALDRGFKITEQIFEFAGLGQLHVGANEDTSAREVVDAILKELHAKFSAAHIDVSVSVPDTLHLGVREPFAYAILRNLIANAQEALADKDGTRTLQVSGRVEGQEAIILVQDSGVGMSEATQQRIFQPFFTTKGANGTGLGLGLSRKLVKAYGGELTFETGHLKGTTFRISLPCPATPSSDGGSR